MMRIKATRQMALGEARLGVAIGSTDLVAFLGGPGALPLVGSTVVETAPGGVPAGGVPGPFSSLYTYTERAGPFRIGAALGSSPAATNLERHTYLYGLFQDEGTTWDYAFAGMTGSRQSGFVFGPLGLVYFNLSATSGFDRTEVVEFTWAGLRCDDEPVDCSGLADGAAQGTAGGLVEISHNAAFWTAPRSGAPKYTFGPAQRFVLDVDVLDYAGEPMGADFFVAPFNAPFTTPTNLLFSAPVNSWTAGSIPTGAIERPVALGLTAGWMTSKGLPVDDQQLIPILGIPPLLPLQVPGRYRPVAVTVSPRVPVLLSSNPWQSSDESKLTVAGSTFTRAAAAASPEPHVSRVLKENWRAWAGIKAPSFKNDPEFGIDRYRITKHDALTGAANAGQDVWGWGSYAFAELRIHAEAAGTLTLQVIGVYLNVADTHAADAAQRKADLLVVHSTLTATYKIAVSAGDNTKLVDLLFPEEGGPLYYGRVDELRLSGFKEGSYTLQGFDLVTREDTYLKIDWDRGFMGLVAAQDGAAMTGIPDTYQKRDEIAGGGGGLRLREPVYTGLLNTETGEQAPLSNEKTLESFAEEWNQIEGWQVVYDQPAADLVLQDAAGHRLQEVATFLPQLVPHARLHPGTEFRPECSIRCGALGVPNLVPTVEGAQWTVYARWHLGAALEALALTEQGKRGPEGKTIYAVREDTDAREASGETDAMGFVTVSPLLPPGDVNYHLEADE